MRIIDSHAHIFPYLGGASGFSSVEAHLRTMQWGMRTHVQPVRRWNTNEVVESSGLAAENTVGISSLTDAGFRVEPYGRLAWTLSGESYYRQYMSPALQTQEALPEFMLALMDHAGVGAAVLQNDSLYGKLNTLFAECTRRWPDRFVGLAQVDVEVPPSDGQAAKLSEAINELGLSGLFFSLEDFFACDFSIDPFGEPYSEFWSLVESLRIPVYWQMSSGPSDTAEAYIQNLRSLADWMDDHPSVAVVLVGGVRVNLLTTEAFPRRFAEAIREHRLLLELALPISIGHACRYPYEEARESLAFLLGEFGAEKLAWGSDVPNVERYCTYRQSWDYLESLEAVSDHDLRLILGENLGKLFPRVAT